MDPELSEGSENNGQLLLVLREMQNCLKRLERHFDLTSNQGNNFAALENVSANDKFPEGKTRPDSSTDEVANLAMLENSSDVVLNVPKTEWCLVTEDSVSDFHNEAFEPNLTNPPTVDIATTPRDWGLLPSNDSVVEWKYYKPIWRSSTGGLRWSTGAGKYSLNMNNALNFELANTTLFYVPYSFSTTKDDEIATYVWPWKHPIDARLCEKYSLLFGSFWAVPADDRLELHLTSRSPNSSSNQSERTMEVLRSQYETLTLRGGSFDIMDFDHHSQMVTYKFGGSSTAADAESLRLDIGTVGPYYRSGTSIPRSLSQSVTQRLLIKSTNWRRLIHCTNISAAFPSAPWRSINSDGSDTAFYLHRSSRWRTVAAFSKTRDQYIFHVSWTAISINCNGSAGSSLSFPRRRSSGDALEPESWDLITKSYTIQAFLPRNHCSGMPFSERSTKNEWTLVVLTPTAESMQAQKVVQRVRGGYLVQVHNITIGSLLVSTLSAIHLALYTAFCSWGPLYNELKSRLPPPDYYKSLLSDNNLPAAIECFRVIDFLQSIMPRLKHAMEEWSEWRDHHIIMDGQYMSKDVEQIVADIEAQIREISELYEEFQSLEKRAETIISAIYNVTSAKESRESRLLGENVKVLTYATVVFLPLSFCTSMWSIKDMFGTGIKGLAGITVGIAVITYVVVASFASSSFKNALLRLGRKIWTVPTSGAIRLNLVWKKRSPKTEVKKQDGAVVSEVIDPEKATRARAAQL